MSFSFASQPDNDLYSIYLITSCLIEIILQQTSFNGSELGSTVKKQYITLLFGLPKLILSIPIPLSTYFIEPTRFSNTVGCKIIETIFALQMNAWSYVKINNDYIFCTCRQDWSVGLSHRHCNPSEHIYIYLSSSYQDLQSLSFFNNRENHIVPHIRLFGTAEF